MLSSKPLQMLRAGWMAGIFAANLALSQSVTQTVGDNGVVDWTQQKIRATGIGAPNPDAPPGAQRAGAIEAAKLAALRNLLQTVQGVNITSETTVRNAMVENDVISTRVQGIIRGFTMVDTRYLSDQSVEVEIEVPLSGVLADALLPQTFGGGRLLVGQPVCPTCGQPWPQGKPVPPGVQLVTPGTGSATTAASGPYTGLIIDAKGLGVMPGMAPKVVDEAGSEVYGSKYVSREYAVQQGMVGYDKDLNSARNNQRVTNNPLVIKAVRATGTNKTDVVVASADAQRIHAAAQHQNFLDHCRVMVLLD